MGKLNWDLIFPIGKTVFTHIELGDIVVQGQIIGYTQDSVSLIGVKIRLKEPHAMFGSICERKLWEIAGSAEDAAIMIKHEATERQLDFLNPFRMQYPRLTPGTDE